MIAPALIYLGIFFVWPIISLAMTSLSTSGGSVFLPTMEFSWNFGNYADAFSRYQDQILRSFGYALTATVVCLLLAYPLAYVIAFKAGRYKNLILGLVILPVLRDVPDPHHRVEDDSGRRRLGGQHP